MDLPHILGFQIEAPLFDDPFSNYYKAKHLKLNKPVWLRILNNPKKSQIKEFQKQAENQSQVNHPFVLSVLDMGQHEKLYYQTFQAVSGESIYQRFKRTQTVFDEKEALEILLKLAELFEYTERKKLVHRALSPRNIFLDEEGIKVHEFGFLLDPTVWFFQPNSTTSPIYISPEQANGVPPEQITVQSDIYSSGIILFHMLAGRPPFDGSKLEIMGAHLKKELPSANDLNSKLSEEVCQLLRQMTMKDPLERFSTVKDLSIAIQQILDKTPLSLPVREKKIQDKDSLSRSNKNAVPKTSRDAKIKDTSIPTLIPTSIEKPTLLLKEVVLREVELPLKDPEHFRLKRKRRKQVEFVLSLLVLLLLLIVAYFLYEKMIKPGLEENLSFSNEPKSSFSIESKTSEEAARLLDFAEQFIQNHPLPKDHQEGIDFLSKLLQKFPESTEAQVAKTLLESKQRDFEVAAEKHFLKTKAASLKAFQEGLFQEAAQAYQQFPEEFSSTPWYSQTQNNAVLIEKMGKEQIQKWFYLGSDFFEEGRFAEAIQIYQKILNSGEIERQNEAKQALEKAKLSLKKMSEKK